MKTLKSLTFALTMPVLLTYCFSMNVIKPRQVDRAPAIESSAKPLKNLIAATKG